MKVAGLKLVKRPLKMENRSLITLAGAGIIAPMLANIPVLVTHRSINIAHLNVCFLMSFLRTIMTLSLH